MKKEDNEQEEGKKRLDKLNDHIEASVRAQGSSKNPIDDLIAALKDETTELCEAMVDKHEDSRRKKKQ